jgi:predicted nucleic acid-binding protein
MIGKALVLDANILIRAVLGTRVRLLLTDNAEKVNFFTPDVAWQDARTWLPQILQKKHADHAAMATLDALVPLIETVQFAQYSEYKVAAMQRIARRDADDWPILASAMLLNCPVWTEDQDFFGTGVATWTSDRVQLYFD